MQHYQGAKESLKAYETDGLTAYKNTPLVVVLPENTSEVAEIKIFGFIKTIKKNIMKNFIKLYFIVISYFLKKKYYIKIINQ